MATPQSPAHVQLGRTLRVLRTERGWSQEDFGRRTGLHRNYVGAIERGEINPTLRVLMKLAGGLDLPLSEVHVRNEALEEADIPTLHPKRRSPQDPQ